MTTQTIKVTQTPEDLATLTTTESVILDPENPTLVEITDGETYSIVNTGPAHTVAFYQLPEDSEAPANTEEEPHRLQELGAPMVINEVYEFKREAMTKIWLWTRYDTATVSINIA